jgi:hypothetical protein
VGPRVLLVHVAAAPEKFKPLLEGLLRETPEEKWAAIKCLEWLRGNAQANISIQEGTGSSRKRPAATLTEESAGHDDLDDGRNFRGSYRTLTPRADKNSPGESTIPDTEPWGSPPSNIDDVGVFEDVGNQDVPSPSGSSLPDTEPPWSPPAPNPTDMEPSDAGDDSVRVGDGAEDHVTSH